MQTAASETSNQRAPVIGSTSEGGLGDIAFGQIEKWIETAGLQLKPDFKVQLAKRVKQQALTDGVGHFDEAYLQMWTSLFVAFGGRYQAAAS